jgi:hypothetical protein
MQRIQRLFVLLFGLAVIAFAGTLGFRPSYQYAAKVLGATGAGLVVAALGMYFAKDEEQLPSKRWVAGILLLILVQMATLFPRVSELLDLKESLRSMEFLVPFAAIAFLMSRARPRVFHGAARRALKAAPEGVMVAGAALILLTLALTTTDEGTGWQIVALKKQWITYDYDLAGLLAPRYIAANLIRPLFAVGGYAVYLLALISAVVAVGWVARSRASKLRRPTWLLWLAVASGLATFYFYNDIYWGWLAVILDAGEEKWPAIVGLVLELVAVAGVLTMVVAAARRKETWRELSMLEVAQLPLAGLNFLLMPDLEGGLIYLPGLVLLMIGSQLLTWGCLAALLVAANEDASSANASQRLKTR